MGKSTHCVDFLLFLHQNKQLMKTKVEFIDDFQIKVITVRGEEFLGHLTIAPAKTEEEKNMVIEKVSYCFDKSESCAQALGFIQTCSVEKIMLGLIFETIVSPIEAQRRRIGNRIRELREEKGMSARELAFHCHIDPSNLSKIEQGKHAVGLDILNRIAYFLDAEVQINFKPVDENNRPSKYVRVRDTMQ